MSDREQIAQVDQDKWETKSDSLRGNEQMSDSSKKIWLKKSKILFLVCLIYDLKKNYWKMTEALIFAHFLFSGERCEWIAHFA